MLVIHNGFKVLWRILLVSMPILIPTTLLCMQEETNKKRLLERRPRFLATLREDLSIDKSGIEQEKAEQEKKTRETIYFPALQKQAPSKRVYAYTQHYESWLHEKVTTISILRHQNCAVAYVPTGPHAIALVIKPPEGRSVVLNHQPKALIQQANLPLSPKIKELNNFPGCSACYAPTTRYEVVIIVVTYADGAIEFIENQNRSLVFDAQLPLSPKIGDLTRQGFTLKYMKTPNPKLITVVMNIPGKKHARYCYGQPAALVAQAGLEKQAAVVTADNESPIDDFMNMDTSNMSLTERCCLIFKLQQAGYIIKYRSDSQDKITIYAIQGGESYFVREQPAGLINLLWLAPYEEQDGDLYQSEDDWVYVTTPTKEN